MDNIKNQHLNGATIRHLMNDFEEYIMQGEPQKREKGYACSRIFYARRSKCKICTLNCTLEEIAVLNFLRELPKATQKEIAAHIGKSERTVKNITVNLTEKGFIERKNGKRNGFWEVKINDFSC